MSYLYFFKLCRNEISTEGAVSSCFVDGKAYRGSPITGDSQNATFTNVNTPKECLRKCQKWPNDECKFFTWNSDSVSTNKNTCWLKSDKATEKNKTGKISGPKLCPLSTPSKWLILTFPRFAYTGTGIIF